MIQSTLPNQPQAIPRAAAVAGLIFSLLTLITLGIIRVAVPEGLKVQSTVIAGFGRAIALVVRIAGYSAYFVDLSPMQQAEIIARTEER